MLEPDLFRPLIMANFSLVLFVTATLRQQCYAWTAQPRTRLPSHLAASKSESERITDTRRDFMAKSSAVATSLLVSTERPTVSTAAEDELIDVYFGCGKPFFMAFVQLL